MEKLDSCGHCSLLCPRPIPPFTFPLLPLAPAHPPHNGAVFNENPGEPPVAGSGTFLLLAHWPYSSMMEEAALGPSSIWGAPLQFPTSLVLAHRLPVEKRKLKEWKGISGRKPSEPMEKWWNKMRWMLNNKKAKKRSSSHELAYLGFPYFSNYLSRLFLIILLHFYNLNIAPFFPLF